VVYSNRAKQELLGVREETLIAHGAVSQACAGEMALGARGRSGADLGLAVTGIAGPDGGSAEKPVGTVWFGLAGPEGLATQHRWFHGDRAMVKLQAAETALDLLRRYLEDHALLRGA
jgi:PncC family amidohydrolase